MAYTTFVSVRGADTIFDAAYIGNMLCNQFSPFFSMLCQEESIHTCIASTSIPFCMFFFLFLLDLPPFRPLFVVLFLVRGDTSHHNNSIPIKIVGIDIMRLNSQILTFNVLYANPHELC